MLPVPPPPPPPPPSDPPQRRGRGRPKGSRNRATVQREQALLAAMEAVSFEGIGDSIKLLREVMKSPGVPLTERLACAKILAQFDQPRLAPLPPPPAPKTDLSLSAALQQAFERTGRRPMTSPFPARLTDDDRRELDRMLGLAD